MGSRGSSMVPASDILTVLLLLIIVVQDFRYRQISWLLLPLLFLALGFRAVVSLGFQEAGILSLKNAAFLVIQFAALYVFYFLKERKQVSLLNHKIGAGDVLFFIAICPAMSLLNFLFYYLLGVACTLAGYLLVRLFAKNTSPEVPLAGCLSLAMILFLSTHYLSNNFDLYRDDFIIGFLTSWRQ